MAVGKEARELLAHLGVLSYMELVQGPYLAHSSRHFPCQNSKGSWHTALGGPSQELFMAQEVGPEPVRAEADIAPWQLRPPFLRARQIAPLPPKHLQNTHSVSIAACSPPRAGRQTAPTLPASRPPFRFPHRCSQPPDTTTR